MAKPHEKEHCCSGHGTANLSVRQSLSEMEFERGIWFAALNGEEQRLKSLLMKGISPNATDNYGYTALHYAARNGHYGICQHLLTVGCNGNSQTSGGVTALHRAAYSGHVDIVKLLLRNNCDPSLCDSDGMTPLHKAVQQKHNNIKEILVQHTPKLTNIRDHRQKLASDYSS